MELISLGSLLILIGFAAIGALGFAVGRRYERRLWSPGGGMHLVSTGEGKHWVIRQAGREPSFDRHVVGWHQLSETERSAVLRHEGPPRSIHQAREFLYEVDERGRVTARFGPSDETEHYEFSFERKGGYGP